MPTGATSLYEHLTQNPLAGRLASLALALVVVLVVVRLLRALTARQVADPDTRYRLRKGLSALGFVVSAVLVAGTFSDRLGGLGVALGVVGAGIAFALQEVIVSMAGWLANALGNFYSVGDRVQLGGIKGDVIDVGVLRTTLMELGEWVHADQYNGRIVRVANSFIFKAPVFNYSSDFPFVWDEVTVPVRYGSDVTRARSLIEAVAEDVVGDYARRSAEVWKVLTRKYRIEDAATEPTVFLVANDNWLEFTLRYPVDYKQRRVTKDRLFTALLARVQDSAGAVQLASATFELTALPRLEVRVSPPDALGRASPPL